MIIYYFQNTFQNYFAHHCNLLILFTKVNEKRCLKTKWQDKDD